MIEVLARIVSRVRDSFSSSVLGTTAAATPELGGGLSFVRRAQICSVGLLVAGLLAFAALPWAGALASLFFFPALVVAGIFGGLELAGAAFAIAFALAALFMTDGLGTLSFGLAAALQAGTALVMRQFFRESRRWGVRYRSLLSGISVGVIVSAPDGQILRPHPAIEPLLGMKWPEYKGFGWIAGVHPDDLKIGVNEPGVRGNVLRRTVRLRDPATGDWRWYQFRSVPLAGANGKPEELVSVLIDVHQRKLGEQQSELVTGEMRHRWKNLMAVITALAQSSQPEGDSAVASYVEKFLGRLQAIQAAGDIAILEHRSIDVGGVVQATLVPFMEEGSRRILTKGPRVALSEQTGSALALAIHELATNAIKYGALSVPEGMVSVEWQRSDLGNAEQISIEWIEAGGPPVAKPDRDGFGTRVVRFVAAREKSGNVDLDFREEGLCCRISFLREKRKLESDELAL